VNAIQILLKGLEEDESVEAVVFGNWGAGLYEDPECIPFNMRNRVLNLEEATPYMQDWNVNSYYGAPKSYAIYVWTNKNVFWITQYDGSTWLSSMPRNPEDCEPRLHGG